MKPASRKPIVISFQSICQSPRKLWATSDQAEAEVSRSRQPSSLAGRVVLVAGLGLLRVRRGPAPRAAARRSSRSSSAIRTIITIPPTYSASVNCQPSSTQRTRPSSQTRFVEANWKASAVAAEAPFWNSDLAIAIAA